MPTSSQHFSSGYRGRKKRAPSAPSRQSGGTSGDLSIPGYTPDTPVVVAPGATYTGNPATDVIGSTPRSGESPQAHQSKLIQAVLGGPLPGLDLGQSHVLDEVLDVGREEGATPEELLAAVETGLVESNLRNLGYGDADSEGWRQERRMYYDNPRNLGASAHRFFDELKTDAGAQGAASPGLMAQAAQGSAYPERYDEHQQEAAQLLDEYLHRENKGEYEPGNARPQQEVDSPLAFEGDPQDVVTAGEVVPHQKLFKWLEGAGGNTANAENIENLNPVFARHLIRAAAKSGEPLLITSAQRSEEEQGEISPGTNPAAAPGLSVHQFGGAVDSEPTPEQVQLLEEEGIEHGSAGGVVDPPHTEFTDPRLIKRMTEFGPVRSGYAPEGLEEAVGDITDWSSDGTYDGGAAPPAPSVSGSTPSYSGSGEGANLVQAAMERTAPAGSTPEPPGGLSKGEVIMGLLNAPTPSVGDPTSVLDDNEEELMKLIMGRLA